MRDGKFNKKVLTFAAALQTVYQDEDDREILPSLDFEEAELTDDFTAMLYAMWILYMEITEDHIDILGFTHVLNRIAFQKLIKSQAPIKDA